MMVVPVARKNPKGRRRVCKVCGEKTRTWIRAHIPRGKSFTYMVCLDCETIINYCVSPREQNTLTLSDAKRITKEYRQNKDKEEIK